METSVNTSRGAISVETGAEGPKHDPYSFMELVLSDTRTGRNAIIHLGLATWCGYQGDRDLKRNRDEKEAVAWFEEVTGASPEQWMKFIHRAESRCSCGSRNFHSVSGFPGETFSICDGCGKIGQSYFNHSAIE